MSATTNTGEDQADNPLDTLSNDAAEVPVKEHRTRLQNRFLSHIRVTEDGCWEWTAYVNQDGYGRMRVGDTTREAHRISYEELALDDVQDDEVVRHRCPERSASCANPAHLTAGTVVDNWRDAVRDGDIVLQLTSEDVREIRRRYHEGGVTQQDLADEWGVTQVLVGQIIRREAYAHVEDDLPSDLTKKNGRQGSLTDDVIREIRRRYRTEDVSYADIAKD